jgi:hypothetical protein
VCQKKKKKKKTKEKDHIDVNSFRSELMAIQTLHLVVANCFVCGVRV